jgi:hypothetical protein
MIFEDMSSLLLELPRIVLFQVTCKWCDRFENATSKFRLLLSLSTNLRVSEELTA